MSASPTSTTTIDVADAVVAEINEPSMTGTVWSQEDDFLCQRKWIPEHTERDLRDQMQITVVAIQEEDKRVARKLVEREHMVQIWLQRTVDVVDFKDTEEKATEYARFAFQIKDYFIARRDDGAPVLASLPGVDCMRSRVVASHSPKDLKEKQTYVGVIELMFRETTQQ